MFLSSLFKGAVAPLFCVITILAGVVGDVRAQEVAASIDPGYVTYVPQGDSKSLYMQVDYAGITLDELLIEVDLPGGFSFLTVTNYTPVETTPDTLPTPSATGTVQFAYASIPENTAQFRMWTSYAEGLSGEKPIAARVIYRAAGESEQTTLPIDPAVLVEEGSVPIIVQQPVRTAVPLGESATLTVETNPDLTFTYQWRFNGRTIDGATSSSYTIDSVFKHDAGQYFVSIDGPLGRTVSEADWLVAVYLPVISGEGDTREVEWGESLELSYSLIDAPDAQSLIWYKDGVALESSSGSLRFSISAATLDDAGEYFLEITNSAGTTRGAPIEVSLLNPPSVAGTQSIGDFSGSPIDLTVYTINNRLTLSRRSPV